VPIKSRTTKEKKWLKVGGSPIPTNYLWGPEKKWLKVSHHFFIMIDLSNFFKKKIVSVGGLPTCQGKYIFSSYGQYIFRAGKMQRLGR
jgi:hypothetical protein